MSGRWLLRIGVARVLRVTLVVLGLAAATPSQRLVVHGPEPPVVILGRSAVLHLSVEGAVDGAEVEAPPRVDGLELEVGAPVRSSFQTLSHGHVIEQTRVVFEVTLRPQREGLLELPRLRVLVGDQVLTAPPAQLTCVPHVKGERQAFFTVAVPRTSYYVHEPFTVTLRLGIEQRFLADHVLQLFAQRLDLPVQIEAPWLEALPGAAALTPSRLASGPQLVLNDQLAHVAKVEAVAGDGGTFAVFELARSYRAERSGELRIPAALLRFAYATRFAPDFVAGSVPVDRQVAVVYSPALTLSIRALPEQGRPAEFAGAVGRFTVVAEFSPHTLAVRDPAHLTLRISGSGNLESLEPPTLERVRGLHVYGKLDQTSDVTRTVVYDVAITDAAVQQVPPIALAFFDPAEPGYRTVYTEAIPLRVLPLPPAERSQPLAPEPRGTPGLDEVFDLKPVAPEHLGRIAPRGLAWVALALAAPWGLAAVLAALARRRAQRRASPELARVRAAAVTFRQAAQHEGADLAAAFAAFLAARLACPVGAVIAPDLAARLRAAGFSQDLAGRSADALDRLVHAGYGQRGGDQAGPVVIELAALVDELVTATAESCSARSRTKRC